MNYELAKKLKDAGYPQETHYSDYVLSNGQRISGSEPYSSSLDICAVPTLSELIESCGDEFSMLIRYFEGSGFLASANRKDKHGLSITEEGSTPEEAVANLWLELNKK